MNPRTILLTATLLLFSLASVLTSSAPASQPALCGDPHNDLDMLGPAEPNTNTTFHHQSTPSDLLTTATPTTTQPRMDRKTLQSTIKRQASDGRAAAAELQQGLVTHFDLEVAEMKTPCFYVRRGSGNAHPRSNVMAWLSRDYTTMRKYCHYFAQFQHMEPFDLYPTLLGNLTEEIRGLKENLRLLLNILSVTTSEAPIAVIPGDKCYDTSHLNQATNLYSLQEFLKDYIPHDINVLNDTIKS